jgi:hypothetical protein
LATVLRDVVDDLTELRTELLVAGAVYTDLAALRAAIVAITAKLDAEDVTNLDTNYAATCDPAALTTAADPAPAALVSIKG